jgi:DNA-binding NarL/FixJ family response regulator
MYTDVYRPQELKHELLLCLPESAALTPRQMQLLRLVADGHTNAQIARRLGLSEGTVRTHLENIFSRLQVTSRTAAVLHAFPDQVA